MNTFVKFAEIIWQDDSELKRLAKELPNKTMDIKELDKPLFSSDVGEKKEIRSLTDEEAKELKEKTGWTDQQIRTKCTIDQDGIIHYRCDNQDLEGKIHEPSGVQYVRKTIDVNGVKVEVVVPDFDSVYDAELPDELLKEDNPKQFAECNRQLKKAIENDTDLNSKFSDEQIEDIMDGKTPEGYTWHHDAEVGKMQLVETAKHDRTQGGAAHTGGKALWGGGY
ncbi:HNH endonuclease [Pseudoneobacillus sp. C159]